MFLLPEQKLYWLTYNTKAGTSTNSQFAQGRPEALYFLLNLAFRPCANRQTDFNYPNALRPETNPGYNTKYDRKD